MLLLTESDVQALLPMRKALECVEKSFEQQHAGAINRSRERIFLPGVSLHYMAAALPAERLVGMKIYSVSPEGLRFIVLLYDAEHGKLLALIEADHLGRLRTGAASGVATKYMARTNASRAGVIGAGRQASTQLEAVAAVRRLTGVRVFGRDSDRLRQYCALMSERLRVEVSPASSAEEAVRYGDIIITATSASHPVVKGDWLKPGAHVNAIGANMVSRRELDDVALARSALIAVDSLEQAREEAGDLIQGAAALPRGWEGVVELHRVVSGDLPGRGADDITVFKSSGIALWDVAVAGHVFRQALREGRGREMTLWEGQDIASG